VRKRET
jgi:RNA-binding protein 25